MTMYWCMALVAGLGLAVPGGSRARTVASASASPPTVSAISYELTYDGALAERHQIGVTMRFQTSGSGAVRLSLPAWTPGAYEIDAFARNVLDFTAASGDTPLKWDKVDYDTWRIVVTGREQVTVRFEYQADELGCEAAWSAPDFGFVNGTNVFLYPEETSLGFPSHVTVRTEPGWSVATGLTSDGSSGGYTADTYHQLVDMPLFIGRFDLDSAKIGGRWYRLATYPSGVMAGDRRQAWWDEVRGMMPPMEEVFGETPFDTYTTLLVFDEQFPGGEALEHENSHLGVYHESFIGNPLLAKITAHEIFHVWNVKRLRPAEMVPYDYSQPQPSTLLWMSEGITDYYADLALVRGGIGSAEDFFAATLEKIEEVDRVPPVALEDASLSTWIDPVDGTATIYYQKGSLAGLMLDILIRDASDNRGSLDDVMRALYRTTYKQGRGFTGEDFWQAASRAAGGRDFQEFIDHYVDGRDAYPWAEVLPHAGLLLAADTTPVLSLGAGLGFNTTSERFIVQSVRDGRPLSDAGVQAGDTLLQLGEVVLSSPESFSAFLRRYGSALDGTSIGIYVGRGGDTLSLQMPVRHVDRVTRSLIRDPNASPKAIRIREGILHRTTAAPRRGNGASKVTGASPETGTVTDVDGNAYRTVKIGNQWWMAENLRVTHDPAGNPVQSLVYNNDESLLPVYGRLYTWDVTMNGATEPGAQGIAPDGWHIPNDEDWRTLFAFLGGDDVAGGALKEAGTEHWLVPNAGATNSSGFGGVPGGGTPGRNFEGLGVGGHYWSSTGRGTQAGIPTLHKDEVGVTWLTIPKSFFSSVRCVKDTERGR